MLITLKRSQSNLWPFTFMRKLRYLTLGMEKKRIILYKDLNEPHQRQVEKGATETPKERYAGFFKMQARLWALKGRPSVVKRITVSKPSWI